MVFSALLTCATGMVIFVTTLIMSKGIGTQVLIAGEAVGLGMMILAVVLALLEIAGAIRESRREP